MLVVMARVPEPGRTKTRLAARLGAEGAAALSRAMAADVFAVVAATGLAWRVAVDGPLDHPWTRALPAPVEPQADGDLGVRLAHALRDGGIAIGTDAPTLPVALITTASACPSDVAFAPAFDGGYVLVRARAAAGLFDGVRWSGPHTLADSVARAHALGRSVALLPFWYDVDEPADLDRLARHLAVLPPDVAPHTRRFLSEP